MYKLRKIFLGTIGTESSWHNGTLLDCTKEDEPTDTYGCLINGGGKSTLVGLFFSVPIPAKNKFIPHVVNNSLVIEDYYRMNVPGYVCLEWEFPSKSDTPSLPFASALIPKKRYVIGSIGYKSVIKGETTLERMFFSVRLSQSFEFEDLPLPVINNTLASQIINFDEVKKWASSMKAKLGDSFFSYQSHGDWQKHLVSLGFSLHDFEVQMRMNHEEGGATKVIESLQKLETIPGKRDFKFIEWMLHAVLNQDEYSVFRDDLFEACKTLKDIPKAEEALHFLSKMEDKCLEISNILTETQYFYKSLYNVNNDFEYIHQYLQKLLQEVIFLYDNEVSQQAKTTELIKSIKSKLEFSNLESHALSYVITNRYAKELTEKLQTLTENKKTTVAARSVCNGVLDYFPIFIKSQTLRALNRQIDGAEDSDLSRELRKSVAGTLFLINAAETRSRSIKKTHEESKAKQESVLKKIKTDKSLAEKEILKISENYGNCSGWLEKAEKDFLRLVEVGALKEGIDPNIQLDAIYDQLKTIDSNIDIHEKSIKHTNSEIKEVENKIKDNIVVIENNKKTIQFLNNELNKFHQRTSSILEHKYYVHYVGDSSSINDDCLNALKKARFDKDGFRDQSLSSLAIFENIKIKAEKFNIPISDDLWNVLYVLAEADIKAFPAVSYIYDAALDNPETIISNNDALTQSIVVFDIEKAMVCLDKNETTILSPVYIIDAKNILNFTGISHDHIIHPSNFVIDKNKSSEFVLNLDTQIEQLKLAVTQIKKESDDILGFQNLVSVYINDYDKLYSGDTKEKIEKICIETQELESGIQSLKSKLAELQTTTESTQTVVASLRKDKYAFVEKKSKIQSFIDSTWKIRPEYEIKTKNLKSALDTKKNNVEELEIKLGEAEALLRALSLHIEAEETTQAGLERNRRKISGIIADVEAENNNSCNSIDEGLRIVENLNKIYNDFLSEIGFKELKKQSDSLSTEINEETEFFVLRSKHPISDILKQIESNSSVEFWKIESETLHNREVELSADITNIERDLRDTKKEIPEIFPKHEAIIKSLHGLPIDVLNERKANLLREIHASTEKLRDEESRLSLISENVAALKFKRAGFENHVHLFKKPGAQPLPCDLNSYVPTNGIANNINENSSFTKIKEALSVLSEKYETEINRLNILFSDCFDAYKDMLSNQVFINMENRPAFVEYAKRTTRESLKEPGEMDRLLSNVRDIILIHEQKLRSNEAYRDAALETLIKMYKEGMIVIDKSCSKSRCVPEGVKYVGGKQILKRTSDRSQRLGDEGVLTLCSIYLNTLIQTPNFPKSGIDIVLDLLRKTNESGFGFKLIKYSPIQSAQYEAIEKLAMSGGERVLTAIMLYLLVRAVKAEIYENRRTPGGFLFFDNPFGKITSPDFVETLKSIVFHAQCQLIAFSTIRTEAINDAFENFVIMVKSTRLVGGTEVGLVNVLNENTIVINSASYTMRNHD